jgi:hypothetical protein
MTLSFALEIVAVFSDVPIGQYQAVEVRMLFGGGLFPDGHELDVHVAPLVLPARRSSLAWLRQWVVVV